MVVGRARLALPPEITFCSPLALLVTGQKVRQGLGRGQEDGSGRGAGQAGGPGGSRRLWQDLLRRDVLYYKGRLDLDGLELVDLEDGKDGELHVSVRNAFRLRCGPSGESQLLCAKKPEQKQRWLKAFARERDQVRLDQETGARTRLAWPHREGPPSPPCPRAGEPA